MRLILGNRFTRQQNRLRVLVALLWAAFVTIRPIFATVVGSMFVPHVGASFRPALVPLGPGFGPTLRSRVPRFFGRCFHGLFTVAVIAGGLVICATIGKAVASASSTAAASAPFARAFPLLLLGGAIFCGRTFCGILL